MKAFDAFQELVAFKLDKEALGEFLQKTIDAWQIVSSVQEFLQLPDISPKTANANSSDSVSMAAAVASLATAVDVLGRAPTPSFERAFGPLPLQFNGVGTNVALLYEKLPDSNGTDTGRMRVAEYLERVFSCLSNSTENSDGLNIFGESE